MKSIVKFADIKIKKAFQKLKNSKTEDKQLYELVNRAIDDLEKNAFIGIQIPKKLIPTHYKNKHSVKNLWKYDLPRGWRLIYSIEGDEIVVHSIALEWLSHKEYEKRFKY